MEYDNDYPDFSSPEYESVYTQVRGLVHEQLMQYLEDQSSLNLDEHPFLQRCIFIFDNISQGMNDYDACRQAELDLTVPEHSAIYDVVLHYLLDI